MEKKEIKATNTTKEDNAILAKLKDPKVIIAIIAVIAIIVIFILFFTGVLGGRTNVTDHGDDLGTTSVSEPETDDDGNPIYPTDENGDIAVPTDENGNIIISDAQNSDSVDATTDVAQPSTDDDGNAVYPTDANGNIAVTTNEKGDIVISDVSAGDITFVTDPLENGGDITAQSPFFEYEGYVYFSNPEDNRSLYRISTTGTDMEKIGTDRQISSFVIKDGWIYYCGRSSTENDSYLYKMTVDGQNRACISREVYPYVYGADSKWVYYSGKFNTSGAPSLCRISLDGKTRALVSQDAVSNVLFDGEYVYYKKIDNNSVYKINANGTGKTTVIGEAVDSFAIDGSVIYFSKSTDHSIFSMDTSSDSSAQTKVADVSASMIAYSDGYLYFSGFTASVGDAENTICKVKVNGDSSQKLESTVTYPTQLAVSSDHVYFVGSDYTSIYRVNKDGGDVYQIA